jgi:hypothetical protein
VKWKRAIRFKKVLVDNDLKAAIPPRIPAFYPKKVASDGIRGQDKISSHVPIFDDMHFDGETFTMIAR